MSVEAVDDHDAASTDRLLSSGASMTNVSIVVIEASTLT